MAIVSVSRRAYSCSSERVRGRRGDDVLRGDAEDRHTPVIPVTTAAASAAFCFCWSSVASSPLAPLLMASLMVSPRRRCATWRSTSHACDRNSDEERKCPQASIRPLRIRSGSGAHSAYTAAADNAAETAAACVFACAALPACTALIADAKCTCERGESEAWRQARREKREKREKRRNKTQKKKVPLVARRAFERLGKRVKK